MRIGIISDTHNFLDPSVPKLFAGVEHILHGGDVGQPAIVSELEQIAPVTAVAGNTDEPALGYRLTQVMVLGGIKFLVHHIVNPHRLESVFAESLVRASPDVVVFGHTHKPFNENIGKVLFLNPGYAGKPRFGMARSVAVVDASARKCKVEFLPLT